LPSSLPHTNTKKTTRSPTSLSASCATITTLLRNVKLDFFTEPVEKTRQDDSKTRLEHPCTRQKSHLTSILQIQYLRSLPAICEASLQSAKPPYNLRSLPAICDDSRSFPAIDSTNSSFTSGCEPHIRLRITFRSATLLCSAPPHHTTISALPEAQQICQHAIALARAFTIRQQRAHNASVLFPPFFHPPAAAFQLLLQYVIRPSKAKQTTLPYVLPSFYRICHRTSKNL
jgi:hypothetical protein